MLAWQQRISEAFQSKRNRLIISDTRGMTREDLEGMVANAQIDYSRDGITVFGPFGSVAALEFFLDQQTNAISKGNRDGVTIIPASNYYVKDEDGNFDNTDSRNSGELDSGILLSARVENRQVAGLSDRIELIENKFDNQGATISLGMEAGLDSRAGKVSYVSHPFWDKFIKEISPEIVGVNSTQSLDVQLFYQMVNPLYAVSSRGSATIYVIQPAPSTNANTSLHHRRLRVLRGVFKDPQTKSIYNIESGEIVPEDGETSITLNREARAIGLGLLRTCRRTSR